MKSFTQFLQEAFNPFRDTLPEGPPAGFKQSVVKSDRTESAHEYEFTGKDGKRRLLRVHIDRQEPMENNPRPAGVVFGVSGAPGEKFSKDVEDHGRGHEVMQAVTHSIKQHMDRTDSTGISWLARGSKHRMYEAIFRKMGNPDYQMKVVSKVTPKTGNKRDATVLGALVRAQ